MAELIKENEMSVNQVTRKAFEDAGEHLPGEHPYVLEAMLCALDEDLVRITDDAMRVRIEDAISRLLTLKPSRVMTFLYSDGEGNFLEHLADEEAGNLKGKSPAEVAEFLLGTLSAAGI